MSIEAQPLRSYLGVFAALMVMTGVTTAIAYVDLGAFNDALALAIAGFKATLVILYFMHVRHSGRLVWVFASAGFFWLTILFVLLMADYATRVPVPGW